MSTSRHIGKRVAAAFAVALVLVLGAPAANVVRHVVFVHPIAGETSAEPASPADIDGYFPALQFT